MRKYCYLLTWFYFFTVPWDHSLVFDGLGPISRVVTLVAIPFVAIGIAQKGTIRRLKAVHGCMLAFFLIAASSFLWTLDPDTTLSAIRTYMQVMSAVWLAWEFASEEKLLRGLGVAYVLGAYVSIANTFWDFVTSATNLQGAQRFNADGWDQNDLAVALALGILISRYASRDASKPVRLLMFLYIPTALVGIALTGSRGGSIVAILACLFLAGLSKGRLLSKLSVAAVLIVGTYFGMSYVPQNTINRIMGTANDLGDMNSRVSTWHAGIAAIPAHLMMGTGAGSFPLASGAGMVAHNTFLSVCVEEGVAGFAVFLILIILLFHSITQGTRDEQWLWTAILICWCVGVTSLTWEQTRLTWVVFAFVASQGGVRSGESSVVWLAKLGQYNWGLSSATTSY